LCREQEHIRGRTEEAGRRDGWREEAGRRHRDLRGSRGGRTGRRRDGNGKTAMGFEPRVTKGRTEQHALDPLSYLADPHRTMGQIKQRIDFEKA
jgi:hypothetical protein